jgi:hypothetical protein
VDRPSKVEVGEINRKLKVEVDRLGKVEVNKWTTSQRVQLTRGWQAGTWKLTEDRMEVDW